MRLSVGPNPLSKTVASGCVVAIGWVIGLLIWASYKLVYESATERPIDFWGSVVPHLFLVLFAGFCIYVVGTGFLYILAIVRSGTWLDGPHLGTRILWRKRWIDLRTGKVEIRPQVDGNTELVMTCPEYGFKIDILVAKSRGSLPARELTALAAALVSGRTIADDQDPAVMVAERLRCLAVRASQ